ncbi:hypothetical protein ACM61V_05155 [Sphingomonas sp. TX0543]|uniref:hypothetical protein n=1 Tax=unclassified Sphingomonas TaxID=196159 RepID=UPI001485B369|nr:hypothetical protein [Sphingomonas sp. 3P27F8]
MISGIATALFIALFAFGGEYFGWEDPGGRVSTALLAAFVLGVIVGYRFKG